MSTPQAIFTVLYMCHTILRTAKLEYCTVQTFDISLLAVIKSIMMLTMDQKLVLILQGEDYR
jgi:hypothetical protein